MIKDTGGPAFPQMIGTGKAIWGEDGIATIDKEIVGGMTLRDLTMMLCIAAVFGSRNEPLHVEKGEAEDQALIRHWGSVAQAASIAADAMLAERNK